MTTKFNEYWSEQLTKSSRLEFYSKVKHDYKEETYLQLPLFRDRQAIAKMRCSDHRLEIERGRHKNTERVNRICKICKFNSIEDENHFLFKCPEYTSIRQKTMGEIPNLSGDRHPYLSISDQNLAKYLREAFKHREETLGSYRVTWNSLSGMQLKIIKYHNRTAHKHKWQNPLSNLSSSKRTKEDLRLTISRREGKKSWQSSLKPKGIGMVFRFEKSKLK